MEMLDKAQHLIGRIYDDVTDGFQTVMHHFTPFQTVDRWPHAIQSQHQCGPILETCGEIYN